VNGFYVKGQEFDLGAFLQEEAWGKRYSEGSMVIVRLCPTDYHRFHFPIGGKAFQTQPIKGTLYSVNPVALARRLSILWENKRVVTEIESDDFGTVSMIEVGATCVGTIHQTYQPDTIVKKGDEKGYFSFGGSCIVLLFEKGRIEFETDLVENSARFLETRALFGAPLGKKK
jgi:phosphatidylserine decarboxylase